jgi:Mor family transcriptional regulator
VVRPPAKVAHTRSAATDAEIVQRYLAGESSTVLRREYGISQSRIRKLVAAAGGSMRGGPLRPEVHNAIHQLQAAGQSVRQIREQLNVSDSVVRKVLRQSA